MARLFLVAIAASLMSVSGLAQAADKSASPWKAPANPAAAPSYDIPDEKAAGSGKTYGSRIFAGTELMPNAVVGVGRFGERAEKSAHAPSIARELAIPHQRKAAVGFSWRF